MYFNELLDSLTMGELRQVYLNSNCQLEVDACHRRELAVLTRGVLRDMHSKLFLKAGRVRVNVLEGVADYALIPEAVVGDVDAIPTPYLQPLGGSPIRDFLQVLQIKIPLSDNTCAPAKVDRWNDEHSFYIMGANTISIPVKYDCDHFIVEYKAQCAPIDIDMAVDSPESVWIGINPAHEEALRLGVAARKLGTNSIDPGKGENMKYLQLYVQELNAIASSGVGIVTADVGNRRLLVDGWE